MQGQTRHLPRSGTRPRLFQRLLAIVEKEVEAIEPKRSNYPEQGREWFIANLRRRCLRPRSKVCLRLGLVVHEAILDLLLNVFGAVLHSLSFCAVLIPMINLQITPRTWAVDHKTEVQTLLLLFSISSLNVPSLIAIPSVVQSFFFITFPHKYSITDSLLWLHRLFLHQLFSLQIVSSFTLNTFFRFGSMILLLSPLLFP